MMRWCKKTIRDNKVFDIKYAYKNSIDFEDNESNSTDTTEKVKNGIAQWIKYFDYGNSNDVDTDEVNMNFSQQETTSTDFDIFESKISNEVTEFLVLISSHKFDIFKLRKYSKGMELPLIMN